MLNSQGSRPDFRCGQGVKHENLLGQDLDHGRGWKYRRLCSVPPLKKSLPVCSNSLKKWAWFEGYVGVVKKFAHSKRMIMSLAPLNLQHVPTPMFVTVTVQLQLNRFVAAIERSH